MDLSSFERMRSAEWTELQQLVGRGNSLGPQDVLRRGTLYRAACADLAFVRRRFPDESVRRSLELLVARSRQAVYSRTPRNRLFEFGNFLRRGFWVRVRERPGAIALSAVTLFVPAVLILVWAIRDPDAVRRFNPAANFWDGPVIEGASERTAAAFKIILNNVRVSWLCAAGGALAGFMTMGVLVMNGVLLGSVVGLAIANGNGQDALEWIPAHGGIELSCFVIAGAAGYRLGAAIIAPGAFTRRVAVASEGKAMLSMVGGVSLILILAGLIEGFVSPAYLGAPVVITIGVVSTIALWSSVVLLGKPDSEEVIPEPTPIHVNTRQSLPLR